MSENIIAYLAKPACICTRSATYIVDPDCPACNRVGEGLFTPERIEAAARETERLSDELDITNADHIALWLERHITDSDNSNISWLACRIIEAHEATARARCEAAGLVVMERRTVDQWMSWGWVKELGAIELRGSWPALRALGLILPDDGETK